MAIAELRLDFVADLHIREPNIRTNLAVRANRRIAFNVRIGANSRILSYLNVAINKGCIGVYNRYSRVHKLMILFHAEYSIGGG